MSEFAKHEGRCRIHDEFCDDCVAATLKERDELLRLNDEYRKALEHISTMDSRVEPMSWSGAFAEAVRVSKDALSEKRIDLGCICKDGNGFAENGCPCPIHKDI